MKLCPLCFVSIYLSIKARNVYLYACLFDCSKYNCWTIRLTDLKFGGVVNGKSVWSVWTKNTVQTMVLKESQLPSAAKSRCRKGPPTPVLSRPACFSVLLLYHSKKCHSDDLHIVLSRNNIMMHVIGTVLCIPIKSAHTIHIQYRKGGQKGGPS